MSELLYSGETFALFDPQGWIRGVRRLIRIIK